MDRIDSAAAPGEELQPQAEQPARSQSRVPAIVFVILAAALLFRIVTAISDRGSKPGAGLVRWQPHEGAAAAALKLRKPVLYDFTAAWCVPCHRLDSEGWGDSRISAMVNDGFVPARVVDQEREAGKNPDTVAELQRRYSVNAFPTLVITDASGREIARMEGYGGKDRLVQFLQDARKK